MRNLFIAFLFVTLNFLQVFALDENFSEPVPSPDDEVSSSGPDTKLSLITQMRLTAFQNAKVSLSPDLPEDRKSVKLYKLSSDGTYLRRVKIKDAKVLEYTNGFFDIKYKDTKDKIFNYNKNGDLIGFELIDNNGKVPFTTYHYDADGNISKIEIHPLYYYSYIYNLDGLLCEYKIDNKIYDITGKLIRRKKSIWF